MIIRVLQTARDRGRERAIDFLLLNSVSVANRVIAEGGMNGSVESVSGVSGVSGLLMQGFLRNPSRQTNPKRITIRIGIQANGINRLMERRSKSIN